MSLQWNEQCSGWGSDVSVLLTTLAKPLHASRVRIGERARLLERGQIASSSGSAISLIIYGEKNIGF